MKVELLKPSLLTENYNNTHSLGTKNKNDNINIREDNLNMSIESGKIPASNINLADPSSLSKNPSKKEKLDLFVKLFPNAGKSFTDNSQYKIKLQPIFDYFGVKNIYDLQGKLQIKQDGLFGPETLFKLRNKIDNELKNETNETKKLKLLDISKLIYVNENKSNNILTLKPENLPKINADSIKVDNNIPKPNVTSIPFVEPKPIKTETEIDIKVKEANAALNDAKQKIAEWSLSVDKANLVLDKKVENRNTLVSVQGEMVLARDEAIKARQAAAKSVDNAIKKMNELIKTVGLVDSRGSQLYKEYQDMVKDFDKVEEKHTGVFDKLCKWIGSLYNSIGNTAKEIVDYLN